MMSNELKHTPGPVSYNGPDGQIMNFEGKRLTKALWHSTDYGDADGRLIAASYNAFDAAAQRLNLNAVELAERMQDGGIADLLAALKSCMIEMVDCGLEHSPSYKAARQAVAKAEGREKPETV